MCRISGANKVRLAAESLELACKPFLPGQLTASTASGDYDEAVSQLTHQLNQIPYRRRAG